MATPFPSSRLVAITMPSTSPIAHPVRQWSVASIEIFVRSLIPRQGIASGRGEAAQRGLRTLAPQRAHRRHREVELGERQPPLAAEAREPAHGEGVEPRRVALCDEADEIERLVEAQLPELSRRRLCDEQVPALDR